MRARRNFAEKDIVPFNKKFYSKNTISTQSIRNFPGYILSFLQCFLRHNLWLPRFPVITIYLYVTYRF